MTEADKKLLLTDLCARLPYGVKCGVLTHPNYRIPNWKKEDDLYYKGRPNYQTLDLATLNVNPIECFVPYLRPMSSITEVEKKELENYLAAETIVSQKGLHEVLRAQRNTTNFIYSLHLDLLGLIEKGLALEAPEGMYKTKTD